MSWRAALVCLLLVAAGCSGPRTRIAPALPAGAVMTREGVGTACGVNLLGVIPIRVNSRAERAYQQALERARATGLTETKVTDRWYWIYVGAMFCTDIEGMGFVAGSEAP